MTLSEAKAAELVLSVLADTPVPASRLVRLRDELVGRSLWPLVQGNRSRLAGGGWFRVAGMGFGVHRSVLAGEWLIGGLDVRGWRLRVLVPDLDGLAEAGRYVLRGEVR